MIPSTRLTIVILLCTLLFSCKEKTEIPQSPFAISVDSVISPGKMVIILTDVHVVEAALLLDRNAGLEMKDKPGFYYQGIFEKYHISPHRYEQNLTFYRQNPDNFAKMYGQVIGLLNDRQKKFADGK
ncbi:MAG: DUF4296 domain-containing protein [Bacteroidales bacterium]|nr:DUF4296 domain-containing protein [Bacteroidales bacterium]